MHGGVLSWACTYVFRVIRFDLCMERYSVRLGFI